MYCNLSFCYNVQNRQIMFPAFDKKNKSAYEGLDQASRRSLALVDWANPYGKRKNPPKNESFDRPFEKTSQQDYHWKFWLQKKQDAIDSLLKNDTVKMNVKITMLIKDFEKLCTAQRIPDFYVCCFLQQVQSLPQQKIQENIIRQIEAVKKRQTHYVDIMKAVEARQLALNEVRLVLDCLKDVKRVNDQQTLNSGLNRVKEEIANLRKYTLMVVDRVARWRDWLKSVNPRNQTNFVFLYSYEDYMLRMLNDTNFMASTVLGEYLIFAQKDDPFIMRPLKEKKTARNDKYLLVVDCEPDLKKKMVKSMQILMKEKTKELESDIEFLEWQNEMKKDRTHQDRRKRIKTDFVSIEKQSEIQELAKQFEKQREKRERLERQQQKIEQMKKIYELKTHKKQLSYNQKTGQAESTEKKTQIVQHSRVSSMPRLALRPAQKQQLIVSLSQNKITKKENQQQSKQMNRSKRQSRAQNKSLTRPMSKKKNASDLLEEKEMENIVNHYTQKRASSNLRMADPETKNRTLRMHSEENEQISAYPTISIAQLKADSAFIKGLKGEIISKIQRQFVDKERFKKIQRQEEINKLLEMKTKIRRQFEERLLAEKAKRFAERRKLEKQLLQEEKKLQQQRKVELQQTLTKLKEKIKMEIDQIKNANFEKIAQLKKQISAAEQQIQKAKQNKGSKSKQNMKALESKKYKVTKELELLKGNQDKEVQKLRSVFETQQKQLLEKFKQQQKKTQQLELLMIQRKKAQKQQIRLFELQKKKQMLQQQNLLTANSQFNQTMKEKKRHLSELQNRGKSELSIQKQKKLEILKRSKQELEKRQEKQKAYTEQLKAAQLKLENTNKLPINKAQIESEVRKQLLQKQIVGKEMEKQVAVNELRTQFEKQLFSNSIPENYSKKDDFLIKDLSIYKNDLFLTNKLENKPQQQKFNRFSTEMIHNRGYQPSIAANLTNQRRQSESITQQLQTRLKTDPGTYGMQVSQQINDELNRLGMNQEQYNVYMKKKKTFESMRTEKKQLRQTFIEPIDQRPQQYERVQTASSRRKTRQKKVLKKKQNKKEDVVKEQNSSESELMQTKKKTKNKGLSSESPSKDEQDIEQKMHGKTRKKVSNQKESNSQNQIIEKYQNKKKQQSRKSKLRKKTFETSESQGEEKDNSIRKKQKKILDSEQQQQPEEEYFQVAQVQQQTPKVQNSQHRRTPSLKSKMSHQSSTNKIVDKTKQKFDISIQTIPQGDLDQFLGTHYIKLPKEQLGIQLYTRHDLYKKLVNEVTFTILIGSKQGTNDGVCVAYHDRNKEDLRKFMIAHIGTYRKDDLFDFCICMCRHIFKKDPCDEVEFSFRFDQSQLVQEQISSKFNEKFDSYGAIYQKKLDDNVFERKYVMKRPFNLKCEVQIGAQSKHTFANLFSISTSVLASNMELVESRDQHQLSRVLTPERQISYSVLISQIFRHCLSPEQAETLKNKVKEYLKLKELLVLIVTLEKKKVKLEQLKLSEFSTLIELNMKLMSQGKEIIRVLKDSGIAHNRIFFCQINQAFVLPFNFQTTVLPMQDNSHIHHINYFRMSAIAPHKLYTIKSSVYDSEMHIFPTQNPKFKLFILPANEYNSIKDKNNLDLFTYSRIFLKNVRSHNVATWKYVWIPQMATKGSWAVRQYRSFLQKDIYAFDQINISYRQFIPGSMIIQPTHKDLVIVPPFIVGILSVTLEQMNEGSPLYIRLLDSDSLKIVESEPQ